MLCQAPKSATITVTKVAIRVTAPQQRSLFMVSISSHNFSFCPPFNWSTSARSFCTSSIFLCTSRADSSATPLDIVSFGVSCSMKGPPLTQLPAILVPGRDDQTLGRGVLEAMHARWASLVPWERASPDQRPGGAVRAWVQSGASRGEPLRRHRGATPTLFRAAVAFGLLCNREADSVVAHWMLWNFSGARGRDARKQASGQPGGRGGPRVQSSRSRQVRPH